MNHLDDALLIAVLDGDPDVPPEARAHLESCSQCRERLERLRARSDRLASVFAREAEIPIPAPSKTSVASATGNASSRPERASRAASASAASRLPVFWKIAAGIVLLGALALSPLRALLTGWIQRGEPATSREEEQSARSEVPPTSEFSFDVPSDSFQIRLLGESAVGTLQIVVDRVATGRVAVSGGSGGEGVVLREGGLDIETGTNPGAQFTITLPAAVSRVELFRAGMVSRVWAQGADSLPRVWIVEMGEMAVPRE